MPSRWRLMRKSAPTTAAPPHNPRLLLHVQMPKCPSAHWPRAQVLCKKRLSTPAASVGNSRTKGSMHISAPTSARFIPGVWNGLSAAVKKLGARRQGISSIASSTGERARARPLGTLGWRRCWFLVTGRTT